MNKLLILFIFLISSQACFASANPDLLIYTRAESKWNVFLLKEFRIFMNNLNLSVDPYSFSLDNPLLYSEESVEQYVSQSADDLLHKVGKALNLNYGNITPKLSIHDFGYNVDSIVPHIVPFENSRKNVTLKSTIELEGVNVYASDISLEFSIKGLKHNPTVKIINPRVILQPGHKLNFDLDVLLKEKKEHIQLGLKNGSFSRITQMLADNPDMIEIDYDSITIPEIKMGFAGRELEVNSNRIIEIVENSKPSLKVILFEQLHELFKKDGANQILKKFDNIMFNRDHWLVTNSEKMFPMFLSMKDFSVPFNGVVLTELAGDFCTSEKYKEYGDDCTQNRQTQVHETKTSNLDMMQSKENIKKLMDANQDIKLLASISEDYLNKVLATTIDYGIWKTIEKDMEIELGSKGVMVRLDEKGNSATILLDVHYDVGKTLGFVLKKRYLNLPIVLKATMRAENIEVDGIEQSHIVFNIQDVKLEDDILINGHIEYGFPSNIKKVRRLFRKKVLKTVKKELLDYTAPKDPSNFAKWKGVDLPPIMLPEISDMKLETMELESDAKGRLNLTLRGSETIYKD